jgi:hypothetical protein
MENVYVVTIPTRDDRISYNDEFYKSWKEADAVRQRLAHSYPLYPWQPFLACCINCVLST